MIQIWCRWSWFSNLVMLCSLSAQHLSFYWLDLTFITDDVLKYTQHVWRRGLTTKLFLFLFLSADQAQPRTVQYTPRTIPPPQPRTQLNQPGKRHALATWVWVSSNTTGVRFIFSPQPPPPPPTTVSSILGTNSVHFCSTVKKDGCTGGKRVT